MDEMEADVDQMVPPSEDYETLQQQLDEIKVLKSFSCLCKHWNVYRMDVIHDFIYVSARFQIHYMYMYANIEVYVVCRLYTVNEVVCLF